MDPVAGPEGSAGRSAASWPAWAVPLLLAAAAVAGALYGVDGGWARAGIVAGGAALAGAVWWRLRRPQGGGRRAG